MSSVDNCITASSHVQGAWSPGISWINIFSRALVYKNECNVFMTSRYSSDTTSLVWKCSPNLFSYLVIVVIYVWWSSTGPNVTVFDFRDVKYELICHCGGSCKNCIIIRSFWWLREHSSIRTYTNTAEMQCINEFSIESGTILA